ncbi:MAG: hypothetical protein ABI282_02360 [Candidatus Baltobacteraceae bacterium]
MQQSPSAGYEARLREILSDGDWETLREFSRSENQIPDELYEKDRHFWEVLLHKLICNRLDMLAQHETARTWLTERGYSTDLGGY